MSNHKHAQVSVSTDCQKRNSDRYEIPTGSCNCSFCGCRSNLRHLHHKRSAMSLWALRPSLGLFGKMSIVAKDFINFIQRVKDESAPLLVTLADGKECKGRVSETNSDSFTISVGHRGDREKIIVKFSDVVPSK